MSASSPSFLLCFTFLLSASWPTSIKGVASRVIPPTVAPPPEIYPISIDWSTATSLPTPIRGMSCAALRLDPQGASSPPHFGWGMNSTELSVVEYQKTDGADDYFVRSVFNYGPPREAAAYLYTYSQASGASYEVVWGGKGADGNPISEVYYRNGLYMIDVPSFTIIPPWTPRYNMSYTQVLDNPAYSNDIIGWCYGGVVQNSTSGDLEASSEIYLFTVKDRTLLHQGNAPWGARNGMSVSSFNGTAALILMMGGIVWPTDGSAPSLYNDVWVSGNVGVPNSWVLQSSPAPFTPRWGHTVFSGGRLDMVVLGGYDRYKEFQNDVWYVQLNQQDPINSLPIWTLLGTSLSGAPTHVPGCRMEYWNSNGVLQLIAMGSSSDEGEEPSQDLWVGTVTYNY